MTRLLPTLIVLVAAGLALADERFNVRQIQQLNVRAGQNGLRQPARSTPHEPFAPPMTAKKIRIAIDDAVTYLRSLQQPNGSMSGQNSGGAHALATLTLLAAGADPASDPQLQKALNYLGSISPNNTYVRGIRANVWEYALRKAPQNKTYRKLLKADYDWLMEALKTNGRAWRYNKTSRDWDNSCAQYGVLGIWAAARAGFEPGDAFWQQMSKHFRSCQNGDGGWSYTTGRSTANMATAGLASMFLVFDMYHGKNYYSKDNPRTFTDGEAAEVLKSLERGMNWLGTYKGAKEKGYYLYGIERAGVASGRKYFGGEDWFKRGALAVLRAQNRDGAIPLGSYGSVVSTSFCTLFLVYGGAPVAFNKLEYGDGHDWNLNPRDLANVTKHLWSAYERPLNWQTVSIDAPASELEAPILFLSGSEAAEFSDEQVAKLREYVQRGGTILAEPSDHSKAHRESMAKLLARMFPAKQYPSHTLKELPGDHGVYTVLRQKWQKRPSLQGVSNGSRTFFFVSDEYLSADWQMNKTESDAFKIVMNLLFYATDLGTLKGKFASILPSDAPAKPREATFTVARVKFGENGEHPRDWDAAAMGWSIFSPYVKHITGCDTKVNEPVVLGQNKLDGVHLLHVTGRHVFKLSTTERDALKRYVEDGGAVLIDAYAGSREFAAAAREQIQSIFGELSSLPNDHLLADGRFEGGADLTRRVRFKLPARRLLRSRGEKADGQKLLVATVGKRPAVIFSEFDVSAAMAGVECYQAVGYKPQSARRIVGNLVALLMAD